MQFMALGIYPQLLRTPHIHPVAGEDNPHDIALLNRINTSRRALLTGIIYTDEGSVLSWRLSPHPALSFATFAWRHLVAQNT